MIKGYNVQIPPTLAEVLADIGGKSPDDDFDDIVNAGVADFFRFYQPQKITAAQALQLEKYVLNYFILRRVASGNVRKWRQIFRNRWAAIIPYYERLIESEANEHNYFENPILNVDIHRGEVGTGSRNTDTDRDRTYQLTHTGRGTHDTDETENATHSGKDSKTTTESGTKGHTGNFSENSSSTEINRYSDTPQGDSGDIWELDAHGNPVLTNKYLTDIRGITGSANKAGNDSANDTDTRNRQEDGTDSATDSRTIDRDEVTTDTYTDNSTENETTDVDETTGHTTNNDDLGYTGTSPSKLMQEYRETFLRIYDDLVAELEPCFYNLVEVDDLIDFV